MKTIDVALKDMVQSARSLVAVMFMFVAPILVTGMFYLMFGSAAGENGGFEMPQTTVVVVNQDEGQLPAMTAEGIGEENPLAGENIVLDGAGSMGDLLIGVLASDGLSDLMAVTVLDDPAAARIEVDQQRAGVAVIIPPNFTDAMTQPEARATIEMIQDPTLTFGPSIVESVLRQIIDGFAAGKIGISLTFDRLIEAGVDVDEALSSEIFARFTAASPAGADQQQGEVSLVNSANPGGAEEDILGQILGIILGGMMVFFAFYTGAANMETILAEEERGTLARLFTTPTSHRSILGGKALATILMLIVQLSVLMAFGGLVFGVEWGRILPVLIAAGGIIVLSVAMGVFIVSFLKNTRQGGIVYGGVLTITGMLGLIPVFTTGAPNQGAAVQTVSLLVPQGWAMRILRTAMDGGSVGDVLPVFGVMMIWSLVLGAIGQRKIQKRFA